MKNIAIISIFMFLAGCTISARNHHFELHDHASAEYDDFNNVWCYTAAESDLIQVCSGSYWSKSEYIGVVIPIIPQTDRESRLAYDIRRERIVEFKNLDRSASIALSELKGVRLCEGQYSQECDATESISVEANSSVWLKMPDGETHTFLISLASLQFKAKLKQFSESRWHLVSV